MAGRHWILTSPSLPRGHAVLGRSPATIGREPECELRLLSLEVSRRHARIARAGVSYTIQDLGSANGTYVNGRSAAKPITLEHEDLITLGTVQLQFLIVDGEREQIAQRFSPGLEETDHVVPPTNASALFAGEFTRETLHQVIQLVELHQHAGVLRVESGGCAGYLRFKEGTVVDARFGPAIGERAARAVLSLQKGEYAFHAWRPDRPGAVPPTGTLRLHALAVVLEILQQDAQRREASADEGFLDERPASGERPALPFSAVKTQRLRREDLDRPRA